MVNQDLGKNICRINTDTDTVNQNINNMKSGIRDYRKILICTGQWFVCAGLIE